MMMDDLLETNCKRKNIQMIPFILISAHILLMSMFQISGSGRGSG